MLDMALAACHSSIGSWSSRSTASNLFFFQAIPAPGRIPIAARALSASIIADSSHEFANGRLQELVVQEARCESDLLAAAFLRSRSFYTYPDGRSIAAQETHQKYVTSLEFETLSSKIAGTEYGYGFVECLVALLPIENLVSCTDDLRKVCKVNHGGRDFLVVGTLDVNQGRQIPGEIPGSRPKDIDPTYKRAYISNFCVAREVRQQGIGTTLMQAAKNTAKKWGVSDLYIHVVATNDPAFKLYSKAGFIFEAEETPAESHLRGRPRRKLLWLDLDRA